MRWPNPSHQKPNLLNRATMAVTYNNVAKTAATTIETTSATGMTTKTTITTATTTTIPIEKTKTSEMTPDVGATIQHTVQGMSTLRKHQDRNTLVMNVNAGTETE